MPTNPKSPSALTDARTILRGNTLQDEAALVQQMLANYPLTDEQIGQITADGTRLVRDCRKRGDDKSILDAFLAQFGLSNSEGVALMCLAEALLRVPDADTADELIAEKVLAGDWNEHLRASDSLFVNASTWALMLTGRVISLNPDMVDDAPSWLGGLVARAGEPVIRSAMQQAMRILGGEFVLGQTLPNALERADGICSFDMLGEGARTEAAAQKYFTAYADAITTLAEEGDASVAPEQSNGISVKLSALHPNYDSLHQETDLPVVIERARELARMAAKANLNFTLDAEEAARLDISLTLFEALARDPETAGWEGLGLAVQCYSRRALDVMHWLVALADDSNRRFMVRLVKGAYWDTEIKRAQQLGLASYPVFTRKLATDLSYLSCANYVLQNEAQIYPQFATHNAHTVTAILNMTPRRNFEFQRLHGMGELLFDQSEKHFKNMPAVRVYAPVGAHKELLAYLVRRLLENGANSSFVNRFLDQDTPAEFLLRDPGRVLRNLPSLTHPDIPTPADMYGAERRNSIGIDIYDTGANSELSVALGSWHNHQWQGVSVIGGELVPAAEPIATVNPANAQDQTGTVSNADAASIDSVMLSAAAAQPTWDQLGGDGRAVVIQRMAQLISENRAELIALLQREAGKTLDDALGEVREAEDFCRYYAAQAAAEFAQPTQLPGPTGETNELSLHGRGVFVCISPWNFPLAIFVGQIAAALAAGNAVVAKPAEQTPLIATRTVQLLHASGVPGDVLTLLLGPGSVIGAGLVDHPLTAGVAMTGSTGTAQRINRALAAKEGPIVPLIAETGGQNAMFVDSTALPEQVTDDLVLSAFLSAGQRCSAVRVLYVQDDIADGVLDMLKGAMDQLTLGDPWQHSTDIGPIIDGRARAALADHVEAMRAKDKLLHQPDEPSGLGSQNFLAPALIELGSIAELDREHFGPLLHVVRFAADDLEQCLQELNATGFGLTLGVHSRLNARAEKIFAASAAGNVYVNRNTTGAVVGVQPFGGSGLSGTGPKAGGPHYLHRYAVERVYTVDVAASGGNTDLFRLTTA